MNVIDKRPIHAEHEPTPRRLTPTERLQRMTAEHAKRDKKKRAGLHLTERERETLIALVRAERSNAAVGDSDTREALKRIIAKLRMQR